jgi:hypothetical protein
MITCDKQLYTFNQQELSYINSVLLAAGFQKLESSFENVEIKNWEKISMGLSTSGNIVIDKSRNLVSCIKSFSSIRYMLNPLSSLFQRDLSLNRDLSYSFWDGDELRGRKSSQLIFTKLTPQPCS